MVSKKITKKVDIQIDSEKLLDEILAKKRAKQQKKKTYVKKINVNAHRSVQKKKNEQNQKENDLIYEQILEKKKSKLHNQYKKVSQKVNKDNSTEVKRSNKKVFNKIINFLTIALSCLLLFIIGYIVCNYSYLIDEEEEKDVSFEYIKPYYVHKDPQYVSCMNGKRQQSIIQNDMNGDIKQSIIRNDMNGYIDELNEYLNNNYKVSVLYYDLTNGFKYTYGESNVYYAASTIKMVVALYIYKNASEGNIDLEDTIVFKRKYRNKDSIISTKYNYGTRISIRELVSASILVSDNSAHNMLVDYVGKNKLIEFGHSLGASYTLNSDTYGSISINDAYCYLIALNEYLNSPGELPLELKNLFLQADENNLNLKDFDVYSAQKYGNYGVYYHNIGIMYDKHPYLIAILSLEGAKEDSKLRINDISQEIYQLHLNYYSSKENYCLNQVQIK